MRPTDQPIDDYINPTQPNPTQPQQPQTPPARRAHVLLLAGRKRREQLLPQRPQPHARPLQLPRHGLHLGVAQRRPGRRLLLLLGMGCGGWVQFGKGDHPIDSTDSSISHLPCVQRTSTKRPDATRYRASVSRL